MSRGRDINIVNRLKPAIKLATACLLFFVLSFSIASILSTSQANAADSPSYQYYDSGKAIGATGGKFNDGTTKLNRLSSSGMYQSSTYEGSVDVTYTKNDLWQIVSWTGIGDYSATCKTGVRITVNSDKKSGSISTYDLGRVISVKDSTVTPSCDPSIASALSDFNQGNISIGGSLSDSSQIGDQNESPDTKQISVVVWSNKAASDLQGGIKAELSKQGTVITSEDLNFGNNLAVSNQPYFKNIDPGNYTVCITPSSIFDFNQCQSVTKIVGTILSVTFGSSDTASYKDGKLVEVTVDIKMSSGSKNGTYGPYPIVLTNNDTKKVISTANTNSDNTSTVDGSGSSNVQLLAKFVTVEPGNYKVCIKSENLCSNFTKEANKKANVTITISADKSDALFVAAKPKATCGSEVSGMGWIICPIINGLTGLNDAMWGLVNNLLKVNPLNQSDSIYEAWSTIRSLGNVAFVIVFLIMIFSQLSSVGMTNYGIKKLLPRLLISAILVNLSFIIIQIAVDLANIIGSSFYGLLAGMAPAAQPKWSDLVNLILAGSVGVGAGAIGIFAAGGIAAAFWMLLPMAAMGALGLLAAVITLIFRQAAIPVLAILAPLAFVAYLLPNTESWYKKWQGLFVSMLMLYPLAAIIFGGAQFAAGIFIKTGGWWNYLIGLIMLTLPLFSLPFIASKSGAIVSKVGGVLNGLAGKAGKPIGDWANKNAGYAKNRANNEAMHSTARFNPRRSMLRRSARLEAADQGQQKEFTRSRTGYIADATANNTNNLRGQMVAGGTPGAEDRAMANAISAQAKLSGEEIGAASMLMQSELDAIKVKGGNTDDYLTNVVKTGTSAKSNAALGMLAKSGRDKVLRSMVGQSGINQEDLQSAISSNAGSLAGKAPDLVKGNNAAFNDITGSALASFSTDTARAYAEHLNNLQATDTAQYAKSAQSFNRAIEDISMNTSLQATFSAEVGQKLASTLTQTPEITQMSSIQSDGKIRSKN